MKPEKQSSISRVMDFLEKQLRIEVFDDIQNIQEVNADFVNLIYVLSA